MPVTLMDRLPLPNLKVYTAGSVVLLAVAVYHAVGVTSDPAWRANATLQRQEAAAGAAAETALADALDSSNATRNLTEQVVDVMTFMMQEPLCMWTLINMCYCTLGVLAVVVQRAVFGSLRVSEAARVKEKLWNYVFYKFIFVFGVLNVQYMDEVLLWCAWFTLLGCLHLLATLCKDRFEYLASSPRVASWAHARLVALLGGIVGCGTALLGVAVAAGLPAGNHTFAFMAAESILVLLSALHVLARYTLQLHAADVAGPRAYYTHLAFDAVSLIVELFHVVHMVWYSNLLVSMPSLVLLMQLRHLLHELQARLRKHRLYAALALHMSQNYPMASPEEVEKNQDNCAICWEPMKEARKLPCSHLFHNSCLCQWVQQDASCPTCRRALRAAPAAPARSALPPLAPLAGLAPLVANAEPLPLPRPPNHPNHLFHFDGSRYVSWLPSFSVEVTRVRAPPAPPAPPHQLQNMARQVQQLFPQYGVAALLADLSSTRSADLTVNNILEGRLQPPAATTTTTTTTTPTADTHTHAEPHDVSDISASEILHIPRVLPAPPARDASTNTAPPPPPPPAAPPSTTPAPSPDTAHAQTATAQADQYVYHTDVGHTSTMFSKDASERELQLQRRKEQLIAAARQKYLEKQTHTHTHTRASPAPHTPSPQATPPNDS